MKKVRLITTGLMIAALGTAGLTSCTKEPAGCPTGYVGSDCKTEVRKTYYNSYKGRGSDDKGGTYTNWSLKFSQRGTAPTDLALEVQNANNQNQLAFDVVLTDNNNYKIVDKTTGLLTYTGNGTLSATNASLTLTEQDNTTGTIVTTVFTFNNMVKQ